MNRERQAKRRELRRWVRVSGFALLCAFAGLVSSGIFSSREAHLLRAATAERSALYQYNARLRNILTLLTDAESGQRGYLLTGKAAYLTPYQNAVNGFTEVLRSLQSTPIADAGLNAHINRLGVLAGTKMSELDQTVRLANAGKREAALALVQTDLGRQTMDQIRQEQAASLAITQAAVSASDREIVATSIAGQRIEWFMLAAVLGCGVFAAFQMGALWLEQQRYERSLMASERQHRAIVEDQTELITLSTVDGTLEFFNPAYAAYFGIAADDTATRSVHEFLSDFDRKFWLQHLPDIVKSKEAVNFEQLVPPTFGHGPRWISWRHRVQHGGDGQVRIHSVGRDITLRKVAEKKLKAREDFLRRIGQVAGVGGWSLDLRSQEIYWSEEIRRIHGVSDHYQPDFESALAFYPPKAQVTLRNAIDKALEEQGHWDLELPLITQAGTPIWVRVVGEVEVDSEGKPVRLVGALQDITQRKDIERSLRELTEVIESTTDFVAQADWRGFVHYLNPAARSVLGISPLASVVGRTFSEFYTRETNERFANEIIPAVKDHGVWIGETAIFLADGRTVPVNHMVIGHRDAVGRITRYTSVMRDISAAVLARHELARNTATLNAVVDTIPAILAVWTNDARYRLVNRAFERWRSSTREHFLGHTMQEAMGADEYSRSQPWIARVLDGETVTYEKDYPRIDEYRHLSVTYTPLWADDGAIDGFIELTQDITNQRAERLRLIGLSERDPLTGLLNRGGFESYLKDKMDRGEGATLAALYIDLDYFKPVNDKYGHAAGDEVLRQFSNRLRSIVRPTDAVARLGGDEFGIVLFSVRDPANAKRVADKVVEAAMTPFVVDGKTLRIGASVGVAYNADQAGGWQGLLARADAKVYEAKSAGRGRSVAADFGEMPAIAVSELLSNRS